MCEYQQIQKDSEHLFCDLLN